MIILKTRKVDRVLGIVTVALAVAVFGLTFRFKYPRSAGFMMNIAVFPRLIAFLMAVIGTILITRSPSRPDDTSTIKREKRLLVIYLSLLAYALLLPYLGFIIGSIIWVAFMVRYIGERRRWVIGLTAVGSTAIAYLLFYTLLRVRLPFGVATYLFRLL